MAERYGEYFRDYRQDRRRRPSCSTPNSAASTSTRLGAALKPERDLQFDYLGLQTLYDRYFLHVDGSALRIAAGLLHARGDGPRAATRSTARRGPSSSTTCCRASTS